MTRKILLILIGGFLCSVLMGLGASPVRACTLPPRSVATPTFEDKVNSAPIILEGVVTDVDGQGVYNATVTVSRYFKGTGAATVKIERFGSSVGCLVDVAKGQHAIFYASQINKTSLVAFYIRAGAAIDTVDKADAIIAITGQPRLPIAASAPVPNSGRLDSMNGIIGLAIFVVLGFALYFVVRSHPGT